MRLLFLSLGLLVGASIARAQIQVPEVRVGNADVRGHLTKETVYRVVRRHLNEARFCYEQDLARNPALHGRVVVSFVVASTGAVTNVTVAESSTGTPTMDQCVVLAVRRWQFPEPDDARPVSVTMPFSFFMPPAPPRSRSGLAGH